VPAATARRAVQRLERKQRQLRRGLPEALEGLARIGECWDRAVTRTLKEHGPGGRRRGRARGQAR